MNGKGVLKSKQKIRFSLHKTFYDIFYNLVYDNQISSLPEQ
jgi:hypothetical protein